MEAQPVLTEQLRDQLVAAVRSQFWPDTEVLVERVQRMPLGLVAGPHPESWKGAATSLPSDQLLALLCDFFGVPL